MDSLASTPSQKQPHWRHSRLTPESPGQPQKGHTTHTKKITGHQNKFPPINSPRDNWRTPVVYQTPTVLVHTNTLSAGSTATQQPSQTPQSQPWLTHSISNMTN